MNKSLPTIFSGIQPTGNLHLGNYLGSIANWIDLQDQNKCLFGIMDLHSITLPQKPEDLRNNILETAIVYLSSGIDPKKSIIFSQSAVAEHSELAWILGTLTPLGWLNRMTQFKDKSRNLLNILQEMKVRMEIKDNKDKAEFEQLRRKVVDSCDDITSHDHKRIDFLSRDHEPIIGIEKSKYLEMANVMLDVVEENYNKGSSNLGLYAYPVLMAADILLYKANIVPVGDDQKQHLELSRDIAGAFNRQFKTEFFKLPEPMILGNCTRIMSLQDGTKKMSKSDESDLSRINLSDDADTIVKKIKKAKTDSTIGIAYDKSRPEIYNLLNIFSAAVGKKPEELAEEYKDSGNGKFKEDLAAALVAKLEPIQKNIKLFKNDLDFVRKTLKEGEEKAKEIAAANIKEIKQIVGLN